MKTCTRCGEPKDEGEFHSKGLRANGMRRFKAECKACGVDRSRAYYKSGKGSPVMWRSMLKKRYGMAQGDYIALYDAQDGRCAICKTPYQMRNTTGHSAGRQTLCVDHDHDSGIVRGLLCHRCNRALGLLHDNPSVLLEAVEYLRAYGKEAVSDRHRPQHQETE